MKATLLLIEDSDTDIKLMKQALTQLKFEGEIRPASDPQAAREALQTRPYPDLVLLNWRLEGRELLEEFRQDSELATTPILVLTTQCSPDALALAYSLGANACLHKPVDYETLLLLVKALLDFWFGSATRLPRA